MRSFSPGHTRFRGLSGGCCNERASRSGDWQCNRRGPNQGRVQALLTRRRPFLQALPEALAPRFHFSPCQHKVLFAIRTIHVGQVPGGIWPKIEPCNPVPIRHRHDFHKINANPGAGAQADQAHASGVAEAGRQAQSPPGGVHAWGLPRRQMQGNIIGTHPQIIRQDIPQQRARRLACGAIARRTQPDLRASCGQFRPFRRVQQLRRGQGVHDCAGEPIQALSAGNASPFITRVSGPIMTPSLIRESYRMVLRMPTVTRSPI